MYAGDLVNVLHEEGLQQLQVGVVNLLERAGHHGQRLLHCQTRLRHLLKAHSDSIKLRVCIGNVAPVQEQSPMVKLWTRPARQTQIVTILRFVMQVQMKY